MVGLGKDRPLVVWFYAAENRSQKLVSAIFPNEREVQKEEEKRENLTLDRYMTIWMWGQVLGRERHISVQI